MGTYLSCKEFRAKKMDEAKINHRKKKRFAARLEFDRGIICMDTPTQSIILCNEGQATGLDKETAQKLLSEYHIKIPISKFVAESGRSYSFLVFKSIEEASLVFEKLDGKAKLKDKLIYLSYVEDVSVPSTERIHQQEDPPGLNMIYEFVTKEEEKKFIELFDFAEKDESSTNLKNRQVKHYGYGFRYGTNDVDLNAPLADQIPAECDVLWERLKRKGFDIGVPDQLTVNKYIPGQGIPFHIDKHSPFGDTILSLSLGSAVVMDWKHRTGQWVFVKVPARSMIIMQGEARYDWQHGIQARKFDPIIEHLNSSTVKVYTSEHKPRRTRISLTFRWTRRGPCECVYKTMCDSVEKEPIGDDVAGLLEDLHVHQVYDQIAGHFSITRHKPWPRVVEFLQSVPPGCVVFDLGSGNGKNVLKRNDIFQIACERSAVLLWECKKHVQNTPLLADCVRFDLLAATLRDSCADAVICIAVIHHFSSLARRQQAVASIVRLLRPGGRALITVWARDQSRSNYLLTDKPHDDINQEVVSVAGVQLPVHQNRTQFQHNDLLVPWKRQCKKHQDRSDVDNSFLRFYHVFEKGELDQLCQLPNVEIEQSFTEEGNCCVVVKKT